MKRAPAGKRARSWTAWDRARRIIRMIDESGEVPESLVAQEIIDAETAAREDGVRWGRMLSIAERLPTRRSPKRVRRK